MQYEVSSFLTLLHKRPDKAKPSARVGQKATDLMTNHKMAGLPKDAKYLLGKPAFFKPVFLLPTGFGNKKPDRRKAL